MRNVCREVNFSPVTSHQAPPLGETLVKFLFMNIESRYLKIDKREEISNVVDSEFEALESDFSLEERMELARELFEEVFDPPISRDDFYRHIQRIRENKDGQLKHFFLPDIPGGEGDIKIIREGYNSRSEYLKSAKRIFLKVGQGEMWVIPKSEKLYFQISMSECSAIVGTDDKNFVIAHISYSAINEIQAVVEFMKKMGISPGDIHVAASVGEFQKRRSDDDYTKRAFDSSTYTALGIPEPNISQFEFEPGKTEKDGSWLSQNLTQVIGCNDALFKYSFDLKNTPRPGMVFPRAEKSGDYKDEEIIKI